MNLVPLQAAAAQSLRPEEARGAIIVGRDAGFANTYETFTGTGFTAVDPLNAEAMERALAAAVDGRACRISDGLVAAVRARGAREWATSFLADLEGGAC
jgi:trehalose-6-phosphate synthase